MTLIVYIKYFSILAQITKKRSEAVEVYNGQTLNHIMDILVKRYPEMELYIPYIRAAVNQDYVTLDYEPSDQDEIAFITPVSGG
ncbi:MAG: MoaD/ThiS family protein [Balneolaceae bacterium]